MGRLVRSTGWMFFLRQLSSWVNCDDFSMHPGHLFPTGLHYGNVPFFRRIKLFDETTEHLLRIADSSYFHLDRHKLRPKDAVYDDP